MATARRRLYPASFFPATCSALDHIGHFVYLYAPTVVRTVDITDLRKTQTVGVIVTKSSPTDCVVQRRGEVVGLFAGLSPGARVMIDETGSPTIGFTRPVTGMKWLQWVGVATALDSLVLEFHSPFGIRP